MRTGSISQWTIDWTSRTKLLLLGKFILTKTRNTDMKTLLVQLLTLCALTLVELARSYTVDGYGLTPILAYPVATLMIALPLAWELAHWLHPDVDEYEHIELERAHCGRCGRLTDLINGQCSIGCQRPTAEQRAQGFN